MKEEAKTKTKQTISKTSTHEKREERNTDIYLEITNS
jgi:hypothetical protein